MINEIVDLIEQADTNEIKLHGKIRLTGNESGTFTLGNQCIKGIVNIKKQDIVIDGSDAEIEVEIQDCSSNDWSVFFVHPDAHNVEFRNLRVRVFIKDSRNSNRIFSLIYNTAYAIKIESCLFEIYSEKQLNIMAVYNNGNLNTHMNTRADNLILNNSNITVLCKAEVFDFENCVYGLYNNLANSISVMNSFFYIANRGDGERQKAIGVYTNGRFGRFVGNNIKANGDHNVGFEKEQAYAIGFVNEGMYSIINSNNIIAEWAGQCTGLKNTGDYTLIEGNKILATHTIWGYCIRNTGHASKITGNTLTSTSRNARLIEHKAMHTVIAQNHMEVLMPLEECPSGCGIYAIDKSCKENIIKENIIRNIRDCGIFVDPALNLVNDNLITNSEGAVAVGKSGFLFEKLDEKNIKSY